MKTKLFNSIGIFLSLCTMVYLIFALCSWSFVVGQWDEFAKVSMGFIMLISLVISLLVSFHDDLMI